MGSETLDDAGVYRITDEIALVQTLDFFPPVLDDPYIYGQISAANALSDVYAMGGEPKTVLNLVGFPDDELGMDILAKILSGGSERIAEANASLIGGHTVRDAEIKYGLSVTGLVNPAHIVTNTHAKPGDVLYLTKPLGTGFVTTAHKAKRCPDKTLEEACKSMVDLNAGAAKAMKELGVRCATDVTGFGFAGHAHEMAAGSSVTLVIRVSSLPILPGAVDLVKAKLFTRASATNMQYVSKVTRTHESVDPILAEFLYDPQTSGGLLMAVPKENDKRAEEVLRSFETICAARVGEVVEKEEGVDLRIEP